MLGLRSQAKQQAAHQTSPVGGLNTVSPYADMPPGDCIALENLLPTGYGCKTRLGSQVWASSLGDVRTIVPFSGVDSTKDQLFAVCPAGVYKVTTQGAAPTQVATFPNVTGRAGFANWASFSTVGGHYLALVDEANGYWLYSEATDTWTQITAGTGANQISPVDPTTFTSVCVWQNRLWFTLRNSSTAYFLDVGVLYGTVQAQQFGTNMARGGELVRLVSWTVDGGMGPNNNLAVLARSGDVSVYNGTDPETPGLFTLVGTWNLGGFPTGRNVTLDTGGDVLINSSQGLVSLSKLLQGVSLADRSIYETQKIANVITAEVYSNGGLPGWQVVQTPDESGIIVFVPQGDNSVHGYYMSYQTKGWAKLTGRPARSSAVWQNHLYFGTIDGTVYLATGALDGVAADGTGGTAIGYYIFGSFNPLGSPNLRKRVSNLRVSLLTGQAAVSHIVQCNFDFDLSPIGAAPGVPPSSGSLWDVALWDAATWGGDNASVEAMYGVAGTGRYIAVQQRGQAISTTTLNAGTLLYTVGGNR